MVITITSYALPTPPRVEHASHLGQQKKKREKEPELIFFKCIYLLVMPKYWGKQIFSPGSFPNVGQKQKAEKKKSERLNE